MSFYIKSSFIDGRMKTGSGSFNLGLILGQCFILTVPWGNNHTFMNLGLLIYKMGIQ